MFWILVERIDRVNTKIDSVKDDLNTKIDSVKDLIEENEKKNQKEHAELEKKIEKEFHQLQLNINEKIEKSEANVKEKIRHIDNTIHKLIGQLEGAQLIPNTHSSCQTGGQWVSFECNHLSGIPLQMQFLESKTGMQKTMGEIKLNAIAIRN